MKSATSYNFYPRFIISFMTLWCALKSGDPWLALTIFGAGGGITLAIDVVIHELRRK